MTNSSLKELLEKYALKYAMRLSIECGHNDHFWTDEDEKELNIMEQQILAFENKQDEKPVISDKGLAELIAECDENIQELTEYTIGSGITDIIQNRIDDHKRFKNNLVAIDEYLTAKLNSQDTNAKIKPSVHDQLVEINNKIWELIQYEKDVDPNGEDGKFYTELFEKIDTKIGEIYKRGKSILESKK